MFGSDVLDAAAIGAGAALLGGIVAGLFSLFTTWINGKTKRREIAYEKQLEALREVYENVSIYVDASNNIIHQLEKSEDTDAIMPLFNIWSEKHDILNAVYRKNAIFIPESVNSVYHWRYESIVQYTPNLLPREKLLKRQTEYLELMLKEIKKYLYR